MISRDTLLRSLSDTIADYREGEIASPTPDHVSRWISQFPSTAQDVVLREMDHVLKQTYMSKASVRQFFRKLARSNKITGAEGCAFWKQSAFLNIQGGGRSQQDMLSMFDEALSTECGFGLSECGRNPKRFVYLDDVLFTGNRVLRDVSEWINAVAPNESELHIITIGLHNGGQYYASSKIMNVAGAAGKTVAMKWWACWFAEDRRAHINESDVLRPRVIPSSSDAQAYVKSMRHEPVLRTNSGVGGLGFFSSEEGRHSLEQELLKAGLNVRARCRNLPPNMRPLGYMILETLGFGSLMITYRNCPNNAPLALWVGEPWYPLFPRRIN